MLQTHFYCVILKCAANATLQVLIHTVLLFKESVDVPQKKIGIHAKVIQYR